MLRDEEVLPKYRDNPPSYDSLYGKIKAAKASSGGVREFFVSFFAIIFGTVGCTIFLALLLAIPISSIVIGSLYLHDCPVERFIPIYLIVGGCFGIVKGLSSLLQKCRHRNDEDNDNSQIKKNPLDIILDCFLLAWFIAGNVWIYRTYGNYQWEDATKPLYCDHTLYLYAFWLITSTYIMIGLSCCCACLSGCIVLCVSDK